MKKLLLAGAIAGSLIAFATSATAHEDGAQNIYRADGHAPIGVMGDHMHKKNEWMLSYRYMDMSMSGNRNGTDDLSPETIVTTITNRFFGMSGQPPTLRIVPSKMDMNMHMVGFMYATSDIITLMAMANYVDKDMTMTVFQGATGTNILGKSHASSRGFGDAKVSSHIRLYEDNMHHVHANAVVSLPTGSISRESRMLMPNGMQRDMRLAYGMQLGSGTYDFLPGITYTGHGDKWGWGAQYLATLRLGRNNESYSLGNKHNATIWGSYSFVPHMSASARLAAEHEGKIDGMDTKIIGPSQAADPDNYGGKRISAGLGLNYVVPSGIAKGHRFSAEVMAPIYQNLNGPQLKRDTKIVVGWSKSF